MPDLTITIDMDRKCARCKMPGATQNGLCLSCIEKGISARIREKTGGTMSPKKDQKKSLSEKPPALEEKPSLSEGPSQKPLFGEADLVLNTLEVEMAEVRKDIEKCTKARERLEAREEELETREINLREAIAATKKTLKGEPA
jgi:hypothetical protein